MRSRARDNDASIVRARQVIDRFEEEETRLAQLSRRPDEMLRSTGRNTRDSNEIDRDRRAAVALAS